MFNIYNNVVKCRYIVLLLQLSVRGKVNPKLLVTDYNQYNSKKMSQKSITSFFKITPKKSPDAKEEKSYEKSNETNGGSTSPVANGKEKRSKRQRLISSEDESSPKIFNKSPDPSPDKIKKVKRQRIESSGSESEAPKTEPTSPSELEALKTEPTSPSELETSKTEPESPDIKVEKSKIPKTYDSPKSRKSKVKKEATPLVEKNKEPKKRKTNTPSPKSVKVKKEVVSPQAEKNEKKAVSKKEASPVKEKENKEKEKTIETVEKVSELEYNPSKPKYHPIQDACWSAGNEVPYIALARTLQAIEGTSARLKMIDILANYFRSVIALTPEDLLPSVYMCLNQLAPAYHSLELGIAETYLMKAIGQCTGMTLSQVKSSAQKHGDLGAAAEAARAAQRTMFPPPPLQLRKVLAALRAVAAITGKSSVDKKIAKIQSLYIACRQCEAKYLIRSLEGKLRIGLAEQSVLQALAVATTMTPPDPDGVKVIDASKGIPAEEFKSRVDANALTIKTTYCECPNYDAIIPVMLRHGPAALPEHCRLTPGVPLKPMLAHPTKGVHEVFDRFEGSQFTCEWKYDGERAQLHVPERGGRAHLPAAAVFSRNQEDNTTKYPDILSRLHSLLKPSVSSCVLDCEAVAYDTEKKQILPFQILSTRKRKDASAADVRVQVCVFVFDLLYLNGEPLVRRPLAARRDLLLQHFNQVEGCWQFATSADCSSMEEVQQFLEAAVKGSCEGLMVKTLTGENAKYDIARRSHNWLKLKKDYLEGVGDTIDVVVIGAYRGKGKRAGVFGGFLLACYDDQADQYQSLCKIGTGFSDEDLQKLSQELQEYVIEAPRNYYRYDNQHSPDVWFSAARVWEVRCADLSLSPAHHAAIGLVDNHKGISLRFPRFIRVREDKSPEQATSAQQIADMYLSQDQIKNHQPKTAAADDFY